MTAAPKFIAYYRVSTKRQGASGLGLDAQRDAVSRYVAATGGRELGEFTEVETGKRNDRPKLEQAMHECRATGATLVIAKLDRLSRNAAFLLTLKDSGVNFVAADMPDANTLTVGLLAVVAQHEREMIGKRTREALAAAKARGVKLGSPKGAEHLRGRGNAEAVDAIKLGANQRATTVARTITGLLAEGHATLAALAGELNRREIRTPRGGRWHPASVKRVMDRTGLAMPEVAQGVA